MSASQPVLRAYDRVADRIKLHRQVDKRPVLVVEGPSDQRLLSRVFDPTSVAIFEAGTRDEVIGVSKELTRLGVVDIAGLVDRDFDDAVAQAEQAGTPLVAYDGADLEDMLIESPALAIVLGELASQSKLNAYGGANVLATRARVVVAPLARLRRASAIGAWGLRFDEIDISGKVDKSSLELNVVGVATALRRTVSPARRQDEAESAALSGEEATCPRTGRPLARGEDLLAVIGVALRRLIGNCSKSQADPEHLGKVLRTAADRDWLRSSGWFKDVVAQARIASP